MRGLWEFGSCHPLQPTLSVPQTSVLSPDVLGIWSSSGELVGAEGLVQSWNNFFDIFLWEGLFRLWALGILGDSLPLVI